MTELFCLEVFILNNAIKKILLAILGFLQGTLGSYLALLGWAFAFPETSPGAKDYEEDMFFCTIWIYYDVRMISHNDNRNYSASKK